MRMTISHLRTLIREELLREGEQRSTGNLAAFKVSDNVSQEVTDCVVFYDPDAFLEQFTTAEKRKYSTASETAVRAYLQLSNKPSKDPCADAAQIKGTWGPGYGDVVYGTAFALSRNGVLMPDRSSVSIPARKWWMKNGQQYKMIQLDDRDHKTCMSSKRKTHTEDTFDDCEVYTQNSEDPLTQSVNYAYDAGAQLASYRSNMEGMFERHEDLLNRLVQLDPPEDPNEIPDVIENFREQVEMYLDAAAAGEFAKSLALSK